MKSMIALALASTAGVALASSTPALFNEFQPNPVGGDPAIVPIELLGTAGSMFSGFIYEIDTDFFPGTVDRIAQVSGTFDSNGLLVVDVPDFENPSASYILSSGGSAMLGDVFDGMGFGAQFGTIYDAVNTADADGDLANSIAGLVGGLDLGFVGGEPELVFRDSVSLEWIQLDAFMVYDAAGNLLGDQATLLADFGGEDFAVNGNFGEINPTLVPTPGALAIAGLGGLVAARRRR